jgi:hypothetical protein
MNAKNEREAIKAAHPLRTGRHDLYQEAMRLVGERHAKGDLVELVNWLLSRIDDAAAEVGRLRTLIVEAAKNAGDEGNPGYETELLERAGLRLDGTLVSTSAQSVDPVKP